MKPKAVNYDQIARTYDTRFVGVQQQPILTALLEIIDQIEAKRILEVGCGTGHWLAGIEEALSARTAELKEPPNVRRAARVPRRDVDHASVP